MSCDVWYAVDKPVQVEARDYHLLNKKWVPDPRAFSFFNKKVVVLSRIGYLPCFGLSLYLVVSCLTCWLGVLDYMVRPL
jgi:hypothetical protein